MNKLLIVTLLILSSNIIFSQEIEKPYLNEIIVLGPGNDIDTWCQKENIFLELNDSTLIKFNESSTFEKRLILATPIALKNETYRIILKNTNNENIQIKTFKKDSVKNGNIILDFSFPRCCLKKQNEKYFFFIKNTTQVVDTYCDKENESLKISSNLKSKFKIIGIGYDSLDLKLIELRINNLKLKLIEIGVNKANISYSILNNHEAYLGQYGSEYQNNYYDQTKELGVILRIE